MLFSHKNGFLTLVTLGHVLFVENPFGYIYVLKFPFLKALHIVL